MKNDLNQVGNRLVRKLNCSMSSRTSRIAAITLTLLFFMSIISYLTIYDIRSPQVTLLTPHDGEYVFGTVEITARVQSPRAIDQVLVSFDKGSTWEPMSLRRSGTFFTPATYSYAWETNTLPDGTYDIMVTVLDVSRRTDVDQLQVIVDNNAPELFLLDLFVSNDTEPTISVSGETEFLVGATDTGSGIISVEYQIDDQPWKVMEPIENSFFYKGIIGIEDIEGNEPHYLNLRAIDEVGFVKSLSYRIDETGGDDEHHQVDIFPEMFVGSWERTSWFEIAEEGSSTSFDVTLATPERMWNTILLEGTFSVTDDFSGDFWLNVTQSSEGEGEITAVSYTFTPNLPESSVLQNAKMIDDGRYLCLKLDNQAFSQGENYQFQLEITQTDVKDLFGCDVVAGNEDTATRFSVTEIEATEEDLSANIGYVVDGDWVVTKEITTDEIFYEFSYELENLGVEKAADVNAWIFSQKGVKHITQENAFYGDISTAGSQYGDPFFALTAYPNQEVKLDLQITWTVSDGTGRTYTKLIDPTIAKTLIVSMVGELDDDFFGWSVSAAGDVNGDGYEDVIIGAYNATSSNTGRAYIFYGGSSMDSTPDVILTGEATDDYFGESVSGAGDVNNDGYDDVIAGASHNNAGGSDAGRAYIFYGNATEYMSSNISASAANVTLTGEASWNLFGESVSGAGDVNNDNYADVIVGASAAGPSQPGRAYIFYGNATAYMPSFISASNADVTLTGEIGGDEFGSSLSGVGDVNGDSYDDIIVGAKFNDAGGAIDENIGRAYLFFGEDLLPNTISASAANVTLTGEVSGDWFGESVSAAGDVNGDGFDDMVVSALYNDAGGNNAGRAYIFYGNATEYMSSSISASDANVTLTGENNNDYFGWSVSGAGDVNNDGYYDVIVGAPFYDVEFETLGKIYIFFGSDSMDNTSDFTLTGEENYGRIGESVSSAGDVNNDNYDNVIIGAPLVGGGTRRGKAYINTVLFIDVSMPSVTYSNSSQTIDITGVTAVCSNPDHGDLDDNEATVHNYTVYTIGGSLTGITDELVWTGNEWQALNIDVSSLSDGFYYVKCYFEDSDAKGTSPASFFPPPSRTLLKTMVGENSYDRFGYSVANAGDVNGDGYDDVIVGTWPSDAGGQNIGRAYIYYGGSSLDGIPDVTLTGNAAGDNFGYSVSGAGDMNSDGYDDVIVGAWNATASNTGRAYIFYGNATEYMPSTISASSADVIITGEAAGDEFGYSVSDAGDVNNDGYDDVIIGAWNATASNTGRAYIFYGDATDNMPSTISASSAGVIITGEGVNDRFGESVSGAGDVNNDNYADVIVGAISEKRAYIFYGETSLPNSLSASDANVTITGGEIGLSYFGRSVSGAGDVNNDGFDDIIVGELVEEDPGNAYIIYGENSLPSSLLASNANVTLTGEAMDDLFGMSVSGAGDVNNDGYDDVIIGASHYYAAGEEAGRVYIFFGGEQMYSGFKLTLTGETDDEFGWSVSGAGDVNGDGYDDVIVGAWQNEDGGNLAGKAYIFSAVAYIDISKPSVTYSGASQTIDITGVTAVCLNSVHGELNDTEATKHTYTIYTIGGTPTGVDGDLSWMGSEWGALGVSVSALSDGNYYVRCYFEDSDAEGTSPVSNTFTKITSGGNGGGGGGDGNGNDGGGGGGGTGKSSCLLDFLVNCYSTKPGQTVTLAGVISTSENGHLVTISFEGETYEVYTSNNGEFTVTVTAPTTYGIYTAKAKFAGDESWESASCKCNVLVVEQETHMDLDIEGNLNKGEGVTITATVTTENGDPVTSEKVTIYIYERKGSSTTSSLQSDVGACAADVRYWDLIETLEVTTDVNGKAVTSWVVTTDNDVQIVAEYAGKVEGKGGENIGSSTASYTEGEIQPIGFTFGGGMALYLFGAIGAGVAVAIIGVIVVLKRRKEL